MLGTNKLAASMGAVTSVISFWRSGNINKKLVISLVPMSMIGSVCGAYTVHLLPQDFMRNLVVVMLVLIAAYTYTAGFYAQPGCNYACADCSLYLQS